MKFTTAAILGVCAIDMAVATPLTAAFPGPGGSISSNRGKEILAKAKEAAGEPYAWGGGTCDGPSDDQPPYDYGDVGYDCSGLVAWAVCQVTGRDLFSEGARVTGNMYCSSGYPKIPWDEKQPGDAMFFSNGAASCPCESGGNSYIYHVGLFMEGDTMWNAPNDDVNAVTEGSISSFGTHCDHVLRFEDA